MRRPVRPLLLVLLWVWAAVVFVTVDLFLNVREFDRVRPRAPLYRGMRAVAHEMVGEPLPEEPAPQLLAPAAVEPADGMTLVEGTVLAPDGAPMPGAIVVASGGASATADGSGRYALHVPPGRRCDLRATAKGHAPAVASGVLPPARVDLLLRATRRIGGRAVDAASQGVAGVGLRLEPLAAGLAAAPVVAVTTAADGTFALEGVPADGRPYALVVAHGPVRVGARVPVPPRPRDLELTVPVERAEPGPLRGAVRDATTGEPIADALVLVCGSEARTDPGGAFVLESVPPGLLVVEVDAPERPPWRVRAQVRPPDPLVIKVPKALALSGRVLDEDDRPVEDALVQWEGEGAGGGEARTGADGRFSFKGASFGRPVRVRVEAEDFAPVEEVATAAREIVIRLEPSGRVEGRVFGPGGAPLPDARVCLLPAFGEGTPAAQPLRAARTDASGRYVFRDLPSGAFAVAAAAPDAGLAPASTSVSVASRAAVMAADLLLPEAARLEGEVADADGRPVAGATVELLSSVRGAIALTDDGGRFVLPAAAPWPERVSVSHPDHLPPATPLWTSPGTPLRLELRAPPP